MDNSIDCPICLDRFVDPVTLQCQHSFCRQCLKREMNASAGGTFTCPSTGCGQYHAKNFNLPTNPTIRSKSGKPENKKPFTKNFTGRVQMANFRFVGRAAPGIDTYQIIFRSSLDNHIPIDGVKSCTTIYELKKLIQAKLGAPTESMRLVSSNLIFDQSQNQIKFRHNFFN